MDFAFASFGTDKSRSGIALRCFEGVVNRRAWEAFCFCIHPRHHFDRDRVGAETWFTAFLG